MANEMLIDASGVVNYPRDQPRFVLLIYTFFRRRGSKTECKRERRAGNAMTFRSSTDNGAPEEVIRRRT